MSDMDEIEKALESRGSYRGTLPKWLIAALRIVGYRVRVLGRQGDRYDVEVS